MGCTDAYREALTRDFVSSASSVPTSTSAPTSTSGPAERQPTETGREAIAERQLPNRANLRHNGPDRREAPLPSHDQVVLLAKIAE
jgi:hypothetical protein